MLNLLEGLNPVQREAVTHDKNSLLILAGPGSGKTRVITTKVAYLIQELRIDPNSILAVTFTNKAASEMRERAVALSPEARFTSITTFHSFCARMLRKYGTFAGLTSDFSIYDTDDSMTLFRSLYPEFTKKEAGEILRKISKLKNFDIDLRLSTMSNLSLDSSYYEKYQAALLRANAVDFDDLILHFTKILKNQPEVKMRIASQYRYILVDEYQDSNLVQFELLKQLYSPGTYLCVVGDEDQSIYRFRGAEIENILRFSEYFKDVETIRLEQNYRSTPNILKAASALIAKNESRLGKSIWTENSEGKEVGLKYFSSNIDEIEFCANVVREGSYSDTAILYRTNAQSFAFERGFTALGIPYKLVGALRFFDRAEIKDLIAWISFLLNPCDIVAFKRIANKPARGFGGVAQKKAIAQSQESGTDLLQSTREIALGASSKKKPHKSIEFVKLCELFMQDIENLTLDKLLLNIFIESGLKMFYEDHDKNNDSSKIDNVKEFIDFSARYGVGREALSAMLERISLDSQFAQEQEGNDDVVTLITIHNTKGLEFPKVIISGLEEGIFPSARSLENNDLEEERRLLYVAMTRAQQELYLTYCSNKNIWGFERSFGKSLFAKELEDILNQTPSGSNDSTDHPYKRGQGVYQDDYGYGVITKAVGEGKNLLVFVQFETGFVGRFLPEFDSLELVESRY